MTEADSSTSSAPETPYARFSLGRVGAIATNTLVELTRQKVFYTLLLFALVIIATAGFFSQFSFEREHAAAGQIKFVKDFGLGAISIFGSLLAIVGTAQLLPAEIENRTLYTILAKPVRRVEFLLGKYMGILLILAISVAVMAVLYFSMVYVKEQGVIHETQIRSQSEGVPSAVISQEVTQLQRDARDPAMIKAVVLLFCKMGLLSAIALLVSTFSTSMIFTVVVTTCVYFIGHLEVTAQEMLKFEGAGFFGHFFVALVSVVIPNLKAFDVADDIINGTLVPWSKVAWVMGYGMLYVFFLIWFSHLVFSEKEV